MSDLKIGVIGAGVVGVTTAVELQKQYRNANISIIANKFDDDTTSFVAAGIFRPGTSFEGPSEQITRQWITDSYNYWDNIQLTQASAKAGVTQISGYIFSSQYKSVVRNHYIEKLVPIYRSATPAELKLCAGNWKFGSFFTTLVTQCNIYIPWATEKFLQAGGQISQQKIKSLSQTAENFDVLINCSGLGAKFLCNDHRLVPIRGQVLKVQAPWIKTFFYGENDTYIIPGFDCITLGGCRQYDSYDTTINKYDGLSIKERCENLVPSLKGAKVVAQRVGLRPHRNPVRVEKEILRNSSGKALKIVHNYGHGGYGVTTAPGTSLFAVGLVKELLIGNSKF